ncbi:hypothetical protein KFK09_009266 [Dendrobium nobile]|uniref:Uncharacterized protein n=1 Tax=Dendrobium nobile TaxID=94219 RepID=A0A8T3BPX5_DENNO|nr:hypothetical protein KFK09_009266 [Dendrobium nobile]
MSRVGFDGRKDSRQGNYWKVLDIEGLDAVEWDLMGLKQSKAAGLKGKLLSLVSTSSWSDVSVASYGLNKNSGLEEKIVSKIRNSCGNSCTNCYEQNEEAKCTQGVCHNAPMV